jgi:MEMO1 family protein
MSQQGTREADHAGSWYVADAKQLSSQLDGWLADVPDKINESDLPVPKARVIIAP